MYGRLRQWKRVSVIQDVDGNNIVIINDIVFNGKRSVEWSDVEKYLRQYVGDFYQIAETEDLIYIGTDLPDEYASSNLLIRHASSGKMYLYDVLEIKKETSKSCQK